MANQKFILYVEHNYSTLDKEFWAFTGDTRDGSLAINLEKKFGHFSWES